MPDNPIQDNFDEALNNAQNQKSESNANATESKVEGANNNEKSKAQAENTKKSFSILIKDIVHYIRLVFDLKEETDYEGSTEQIKKNIEFKGSNAWILAISIFICSIALNVNSTAVVIGAMLISPIMGPIVGAGLALGTNDFATLKVSARSWLTALLIGLITSTLYFVISPMAEIQSELLARTKPTILDVAIAFLGGAAGVISATRPGKSNVIPGVAIATALMPPLCTAGFGLAVLNYDFFWGAFYLFLLNSVFICLATYLGVRYLRYPKVAFVSQKKERIYKRWLVVGLFIIVLPSSYKFLQIWRETIWNRDAHLFVHENFEFSNTDVVNTKYKFNNTKEIADLFRKKNQEKPDNLIDIFLIGSAISEEKLVGIKDLMPEYNLEHTVLRVHQAGTDSAAFGRVSQELKVGIIEDLYTKNDSILSAKQKEVDELKVQIQNLESVRFPVNEVLSELMVQYPAVKNAGLSELVERNEVGELDTVPILTFYCPNDLKGDSLTTGDKTRIKNWLKIRLGVDDVRLMEAY